MATEGVTSAGAATFFCAPPFRALDREPDGDDDDEEEEVDDVDDEEEEFEVDEDEELDEDDEEEEELDDDDDEDEEDEVDEELELDTLALSPSTSPCSSSFLLFLLGDFDGDGVEEIAADGSFFLFASLSFSSSLSGDRGSIGEASPETARLAPAVRDAVVSPDKDLSSARDCVGAAVSFDAFVSEGFDRMAEPRAAPGIGSAVDPFTASAISGSAGATNDDDEDTFFVSSL